ncbi:MAG: hypothetical protein KCHDKBKB_02978 [Elusimicrobia bacterium]|nr:hypothetical protein [Elusimicrobiota bacterium]
MGDKKEHVNPPLKRIAFDAMRVKDVISLLKANQVRKFERSPMLRFKVPDKGATSFEADTLDGEVLEVQEIVGIIVDSDRSRAYFPNGYRNNSRAKPDCISRDMETGTKYGTCASCKFSAWTETAQPLCRQRVVIYVMSEVSELPITIQVPPGSFASLSAFGQSLALKRLKRIDEVVARIFVDGGKIRFSVADDYEAPSEGDVRTIRETIALIRPNAQEA